MTRPSSQVLGRVLWDLFPGLEVRATEGYRFDMQAATERRPVHGTYLSVELGIWVEINIHPSPTGLSVYFRDITDRQRAQAALRESEARYKILVETSPDAIHVHQDGRLVFANTRAARLFGADSPEVLVGRPIFDLVAPESLALARSRTAALSEPGARAGLAELTFRRLDGSLFPVEADAAAVLIDGRLAIQVVFRDITERRRAEAALRESEARLRLAVEVTGLGTWDVDVRAGVEGHRDRSAAVRPARRGHI